MYLKEAINRHILNEKQRNLSPKTITLKRSVLEKLPFLKVEEINFKSLSDYIKKWDYLSSSAQKSYSSILRTFFKELSLHQLAKQLPKVKRQNKLLRFIPSQAALVKVLSACPESEERAVLYLLYGCGLRISEALNLKYYDFDQAKKTLCVRQTKTKRDRLIPIPKYVLAELEKLKAREQIFELTYSQVYHFIRKYLNCCPHDLRHYSAIHLLENGASLVYVSEFLGHQSLRSTSIYTCYVKTKFKATYRHYHPRS